MNIIESLDTYTSAQKYVGNNFIALGIILFCIAAVAWFVAPRTSLLSGLLWGAVICGILIIVGGLSYRSFCTKTQVQMTQTFEQDKNEFVQIEKQRMAKVVKEFPIYQYSFGACMVIALGVILFLNRPFVSGVSFAVLLMFLGVLIFEAFSKFSIDQYYDIVSKL